MTKEVVIRLRDDIDSELGETVKTREFSFDGVAYEIELSEENFEQFKLDMEPYLAVARPAKKRRKLNSKAKKKAVEPECTQGYPQAQMRAWARENGYEVAGRGNVSTEVRNAYAAAHRRKRKGR